MTAARASNSGGRYRIGIRLPDWAKGFGNRIFRGILDFVREEHALEIEVEQASGGDLEPVHIGEDWRGDGLLVFRHSEAEARAWRARGIPVVNLSAERPATGPRFPQVTVDNEACGRRAAGHLLGLGVREFAYWHDPGRRYSRERLAGFREGLARDGCECRVLEVEACRIPMERRPQWVAETGRRLMAGLATPLGLFAKDDISGACALRALREAGLRCPGDAAVLGVGDDIVYCHLASPALSSIRFPGRKIGYAAVGLLYEMMTGKTVPANRRVRVPPGGIVARESSGHVELPDAAVTRALEIIRRHGGRGKLSAEELSRSVGISREALRRRFHASLGHPPKREIDRVRAARIAELLRGTDWTLETIASRCGFSGPDELSRFFKRITGSTPGSMRRKG